MNPKQKAVENVKSYLDKRVEKTIISYWIIETEKSLWFTL